MGLVRGLGGQDRPGRGRSNSIAGPFFNFSVPEPTGVVGVVAPQSSSLLGLVSVLAPVLVTGNSVVLLRARSDRCRPSPSPRCLPPLTFPVVR